MGWNREDFINKLAYTGPGSRIWIYQAPKAFSAEQKKAAMEEAGRFLQTWNTHGTPLSADAGILYDQFLVFVADEKKVAASGCSIDQSVGLVRKVAELTGLDLFDRHSVAFMKNGKVETYPLSSLSMLLEKGIIRKDTPVFNNLVQKLGELEQGWQVPLSESWHVQFLDQHA